jgi:hypothetical protein
MKTRALKLLLFLVLCLHSATAVGMDLAEVPGFLIRKILARPSSAMTGSEFARYVSPMGEVERERTILSQLVRGNLPDFLRKLVPVRFVHRFEDGKITTATIFVMPDYLSIGSDHDFLRMPMDLHTATEIAIRFGFILPTRKMVDAVFDQSAFHFSPEPMPAGPQMRSTPYYVKHHQKIEEQRSALRCPLDALISGHKKDVVLTGRLSQRIGKIAIYGWHRLSGIPIQPLSTVHDAGYEDYSHGIRLVSDTVLIDGQSRSAYGVLKDPRLAKVLNDEGAIPEVRRLMAFHRP